MALIIINTIPAFLQNCFMRVDPKYHHELPRSTNNSPYSPLFQVASRSSLSLCGRVQKRSCIHIHTYDESRYISEGIPARAPECLPPPPSFIPTNDTRDFVRLFALSRSANTTLPRESNLIARGSAGGVRVL